jgi:hypothetical protein
MKIQTRGKIIGGKEENIRNPRIQEEIRMKSGKIGNMMDLLTGKNSNNDRTSNSSIL